MKSFSTTTELYSVLFSRKHFSSESNFLAFPHYEKLTFSALVLNIFEYQAENKMGFSFLEKKVGF